MNLSNLTSPNEQRQQLPGLTPKNWRQIFPMLSQLDQGEAKMLIEDVLPEGTTFIGSRSGVGKTWVALSMAKALRTGRPFLGLYSVPEKVAVAYLVPEMSGRAIRKRAERMGIPDDDGFHCWTLQQGILRLHSLPLKAMIEEMRPVIFLDTAVRFLSGKDENSSSDNAEGLANAVFALLRFGARAVVCLHHSPKNSGKSAFMTLENVLRGTGDLGAMAEVVWGIERDRRRKGRNWDREYEEESMTLTRLRMECVKGRDLESVAGPLVIQGRPYIDKTGDFRVLSNDGIKASSDAGSHAPMERLKGAIQADRHVSLRNLSRTTGWSTNDVKKHAKTCGYQWTEQGWYQDSGEQLVPQEAEPSPVSYL